MHIQELYMQAKAILQAIAESSYETQAYAHDA